VIIAEQTEAFTAGQELLAKLTAGKVYVCAAEGADIPLGKAGTSRTPVSAARTRQVLRVRIFTSWRE
jgi:Na+-transporting NADH:ubiquinone oxidoreductase subunit NqrA